MQVNIEVPDPGLVLLIGPSGSGKSTFAAKHFRPSEVLSSDLFREMVGGERDPRSASGDAFLSLRFVAAKRLRRRAFTVIDATNLNPRSRSPFVGLAARHGLASAGIVFCLPESVVIRRNQAHRRLEQKAIGAQLEQVREAVFRLSSEGIARLFVLESEQAVDQSQVVRVPAAARPDPNPGNEPEQIELI